MKKGARGKGQGARGKGQGFFYLLPIAYCLLPISVLAEDVPAREVVKTPKVYIVREGDNLWDISKKYLNNPFKWQEVWNNNKFIVNPDLIYPGDNIVIPGLFDEVEKEVSLKAEPEVPTQAEEEKIEKREEAEKKEEVDKEKIPPLSEVILPPPPPEKVPLTTLQTLTTAGYIISHEKEKGIIFDSPESRTIFGRGDTVYITVGEKEGVKVTDRFTIYKPIREVNHPVTGENVGTLIETLGELEIKEVRQNSSTASIIESYGAVGLGDKLREREDITVPMIDPAAKVEAKDIAGYIIDAKDHRDTVATGDIVYIDAGKDKGVSTGDKFTILKSGEKIKKETKLPKIIVGSLQVIVPREKTSTAVIIESRKEIAIGEMIEYEVKR